MFVIFNMHGMKEASNNLRIIWFIIHTALLYIAYLLCFDEGFLLISDKFEINFSSGNFCRKNCLFSFGAIMYVRMNITNFYLLKRKMKIEELFGVITACAAYQIGFMLLGGWQSEPLMLIDVLGILLFIIGSYINTYSEIQRKRFKDDPNNNGKLYTQGLFKYARHINYFGDICWVTGWAIVTNNIWSMFIPISLTLGFIFLFIPELSRYLETNYVDEYLDWKKETKKLIPFIY